MSLLSCYLAILLSCYLTMLWPPHYQVHLQEQRVLLRRTLWSGVGRHPEHGAQHDVWHVRTLNCHTSFLISAMLKHSRSALRLLWVPSAPHLQPRVQLTINRCAIIGEGTSTVSRTHSRGRRRSVSEIITSLPPFFLNGAKCLI